MTSLFIVGLNDNTGVANPINLQVLATVLSKQTYKLNVTYGAKGNVTRLHYSMIIYDAVDV